MIKETMSSRERVIKTINHDKVDRVPIDLGAHFSTGISAYAYWNLRKYLGYPTDNIEMADCVQCLARVQPDIIDRFHIDTILLNPPWRDAARWNPRGEFSFLTPPTFKPLRNEDGSYYVHTDEGSMYMPSGGYFFDGCWPDFYNLQEDDRIDLFASNAENIYKNTDKFTILMGFSGFFYDLEFACEMLLEPDLCKERNRLALINQIRLFDKINKKYGSFINAIEVNSDLGTQNALLCSPDSYEAVCYPYLKEFCSYVHENSGIKIFMHSCGAISQALPLIIDAGVDIINPVQISASNMDPSLLKAKYGDKITFWGGGCDTQNILWKQTPEQIAIHTKALVEIFKPNYGYVFNQVHNIMGNVPPENIVAMMDSAYDNSFY